MQFWGCKSQNIELKGLSNEGKKLPRSALVAKTQLRDEK